jgi:hypothetical protein
MKNKELFIGLVLFLLTCLAVFAGGCTTTSDNANTNAGSRASSGTLQVEKVEILHFHATRQCYSCITLGDYAEATVNTYFAPEVASGKVTFAHINMDLPENKELVEQYGPTGSSLWIGVYTPDGFYKEEDIIVWYRIGNQDEYMTYLKGVIEKRLAGDLS